VIPEPKAADLSINQLILRFWPHAEQHYRRPDGTTTNELNDFRLSLQPLKRLYGHTLAKDFGPIALEAVRKAMIIGSYLTEKEKEERKEGGRPLTLSLGVVNQRVGRIRRLFRWAVSKELVPAPVLTALSALRGLERGRSSARETEPVGLIQDHFVEATLLYLLPTVADIVMVQLLTGARPGEICDLRACDVDRTGKVWLYKPASHKTAYRGLERVIPIGPRAQEIIRRRLKPNVQAYLFQPQEAMQEKWERDRKQRKTKVYPCEGKRRRPRKVTHHYSTVNYTISIRRAIQKANKDGKAMPHGTRTSCGTQRPHRFGAKQDWTPPALCSCIDHRQSPRSMPNSTWARQSKSRPSWGNAAGWPGSAGLATAHPIRNNNCASLAVRHRLRCRRRGRWRGGPSPWGCRYDQSRPGENLAP
jgi:integrase